MRPNKSEVEQLPDRDKYSWFIARSVSLRITPQQTKVLTKKSEILLIVAVSMAKNEEREVQDVLDKVDEL